jgi:hypothetical protein
MMLRSVGSRSLAYASCFEYRSAVWTSHDLAREVILDLLVLQNPSSRDLS